MRNWFGWLGRASAALAVSDIPFNGPISEVRVARIDGQFVINPKASDLKSADIDMIVGGSIDSVAMVEGEMNEVSEEEMLEAIAFAHEAIKVQCQAQMELAEMVGKMQKREFNLDAPAKSIASHIAGLIYPKARIEELFHIFATDHVAVVVDASNVVGVISKIDLIEYLSRGR